MDLLKRPGAGVRVKKPHDGPSSTAPTIRGSLPSQPLWTTEKGAETIMQKKANPAPDTTRIRRKSSSAVELLYDTLAKLVPITTSLFLRVAAKGTLMGTITGIPPGVNPTLEINQAIKHLMCLDQDSEGHQISKASLARHLLPFAEIKDYQGAAGIGKEAFAYGGGMVHGIVKAFIPSLDPAAPFNVKIDTKKDHSIQINFINFSLSQNFEGSKEHFAIVALKHMHQQNVYACKDEEDQEEFEAQLEEAISAIQEKPNYETRKARLDDQVKIIQESEQRDQANLAAVQVSSRGRQIESDVVTQKKKKKVTAHQEMFQQLNQQESIVPQDFRMMEDEEEYEPLPGSTAHRRELNNLLAGMHARMAARFDRPVMGRRKLKLEREAAVAQVELGAKIAAAERAAATVEADSEATDDEDEQSSSEEDEHIEADDEEKAFVENKGKPGNAGPTTTAHVVETRPILSPRDLKRKVVDDEDEIVVYKRAKVDSLSPEASISAAEDDLIFVPGVTGPSHSPGVKRNRDSLDEEIPSKKVKTSDVEEAQVSSEDEFTEQEEAVPLKPPEAAKVTWGGQSGELVFSADMRFLHAMKPGEIAPAWTLDISSVEMLGADDNCLKISVGANVRKVLFGDNKADSDTMLTYVDFMTLVNPRIEIEGEGEGEGDGAEEEPSKAAPEQKSQPEAHKALPQKNEAQCKPSTQLPTPSNSSSATTASSSELEPASTWPEDDPALRDGLRDLFKQNYKQIDHNHKARTWPEMTVPEMKKWLTEHAPEHARSYKSMKKPALIAIIEDLILQFPVPGDNHFPKNPARAARFRKHKNGKYPRALSVAEQAAENEQIGLFAAAAQRHGVPPRPPRLS